MEKKKLVFYKCEHCGNVAIKIFDSGVPIICCGEPMKEMVPNTTDAALEKHVPDVTVDGNTVHVQIGSTIHPMIDVHWITNIILETEQGYQDKALFPGDEPIVDFAVVEGDKPLRVYEYCNVHGLWVKELA